MKKLLLISTSAFMALALFASPVSAQNPPVDPITPPAQNTAAPAPTNEETSQTTYRGIIPGTSKPGGNAAIDCDSAADLAELGAKIHCGKVTLNDFPALVVYLIQWVLTLAGGIAVIMIMVGGFQYMLGGVTDDKERGKKTLIYAIGGLIVAFMAWWIVELIQVWITS